MGNIKSSGVVCDPSGAAPCVISHPHTSTFFEGIAGYAWSDGTPWEYTYAKNDGLRSPNENVLALRPSTGCSWHDWYTRTTRRTNARYVCGGGSNDPVTFVYDKNYQYGTPCPALGKFWEEAGFEYGGSNFVDLVVPKGKAECADVCGVAGKLCKSWSYDLKSKKCFLKGEYMQHRTSNANFVSGLPKRIATPLIRGIPVDCPHKTWSDCMPWPVRSYKNCPSGYSTKVKKCGLGEYLECYNPRGNGVDYGCGCGKPCPYSQPPIDRSNFARFCTHMNPAPSYDDCCDLGHDTRPYDFGNFQDCPKKNELSYVEIVGDQCSVSVVESNGKKRSLRGAGKYTPGPSTFNNDAAQQVIVTCTNRSSGRRVERRLLTAVEGAAN